MRRADDGWFAGKARWLMFPTTVANLLVAGVACFYASQALELPQGEALRTFWVVTGLAALAAVLQGEMRAHGRMKTLRGLGDGSMGFDRAHLIATLKEVHPFADFAAGLSVQSWFGAVLVIGSVMRLFEGASWALVGRIVAIGVLFGPMSSALVNLLVMRRARQIIEQISLRLEVADVIGSIPAQRQRVRARVVVFTAVMVVLPAMMMVDVSHELSLRAFAKVVAAPLEQQAAVMAAARVELYSRLGLLFAVVLALAALTAWAGGSVIADPMRKVADEAQRMAKGELREPRVFGASDEVWAVASTFSLMQSHLQNLLRQLTRAGVSIASTTEQLVATSTRYEAGAAEQAASLNETSATTEELAQSARQISQNASSVADTAQETLDAAQAGQAGAEAFAKAVERMRQDNRSIAEAVSRLQRRVQQIGKIVEFINTVADRSDLLALSAELEGTKAGDVGRGFTLVAAEMRRLAENVLESTNEIEELISEIREATAETVKATERGLEQTVSSTALAGKVTIALGEVVALATETSQAVRTISLATQQQQSGTDQLAEAMADILGITQQSLAATKQLTGANNQLVDLSGTLSGLVDRFKLTDSKEPGQGRFS